MLALPRKASYSQHWALRAAAAVALALTTACSHNSAIPREHIVGPYETEDSILRHRCISVLLQGLRSGEFWPSMHAAEAFTEAGMANLVLQTLGPRLARETDDQRRCGLAREQIRAGDSRHIELLLSILGDTDSNGRVHAAESIFKVRVGLALFSDNEDLRCALEEDNPPLEMMAAAALVRGGNPLYLSHIRRHLGSDEAPHRRIAAWALGQVGEERDRATLQQAAGEETDALTLSFIMNALARLNTPGVIEDVVSNLRSHDPTIRAYAAETLGACEEPDLLTALVPRLRDSHLDTRVRSAQSILHLIECRKRKQKLHAGGKPVLTPSPTQYRPR